MANIHEKDRGYALLRYYVDFIFRSAYRRIAFHGKEKIPQDGAVIYACNHSNTLMDALAILAINKTAKVFVARADVFKHPTILKVLTFLKMLPIHRMRDGKESLAKNEKINDIAVDTLKNKVPFVILPEGTHRAMHSIMPLQKGLFRIALQANDTFGDQMPVYIVPVGIEFGHFFRYRSSLLVQIGGAINVTQFVSQHPDLAVPEQMNALRNDLSERLKELILHIPDDEHYNATLALAQMNSIQNSLLHRFEAAKKTVRELTDSLKSKPEETQPLLAKAAVFSTQRHALGIGISSVLQSHIGWSIFGRCLFMVVGLPWFLISAATTSPVTLLSLWLCSRFEDPAFHNTLKFMILLALFPILFLLSGALVGVLYSWMWGAVAALLLLPSFFFLHEYLRAGRLLISDIKWLLHRKNLTL